MVEYEREEDVFGYLREAGEEARIRMGRGPRPVVTPLTAPPAPTGPTGRQYPYTGGPAMERYVREATELAEIPFWEAPAGRALRGMGEEMRTGQPATIPRTAIQDLSQGIVDRVLDRTADYATRVEGRIKPPTAPAAPVVERPTLESVWGIGRETLPTGAARYTVPGEGVMTAEPETAVTRRGDEEARLAVMGGIIGETFARERGIEAETTYREQVERARREQAATDARIEEERLQEAAGIIPRRGMAEYEYSAARMRMTPAERKAQDEATGEAKKVYITGRAAREAAEIQKEGVISAAGMKAQTETAKLGLTAADVKSRIQFRQAQMDEIATKTGLLEPMKLKLQGAKDAVTRTKIQRDTYESANKQIYDKSAKTLQDKFNMGQVDPIAYDTEMSTLTRNFAARQDMIADMYPMEGQTHSSGVAVFRNGIWVDTKKKGVIK